MEWRRKINMNFIKSISAALCAAITLCGCWPQEDPNQIYTLVLDNGKIQRTLKIPGAYLPQKLEDNSAGFWVQFSYPALQPVASRTPADDSIELFIKLAFDVDKPSMSEFNLMFFQKKIKKYGVKSTTQYLGKIGNYEVYEDWYSNSSSIKRTYFRKDKKGQLISIEECPGLRTSNLRRYADGLELRFNYSPTLMANEAEVDAAVTKLVESWLQK